MNSNPRNSLDYSDSGLEQFGGNTLLEVLQEKTTEESSTKYVLIKHDYYSSDTDHGRDMLACFLDGLAEISTTSLVIYLVDKGTLLLDKSNPLYEKMQALTVKAEMVIADNESIITYGVDTSDAANLEIHSMRSIAEDLICLPWILTLE